MHYFRWGPLPEGKHRASFGVTSQVLAQSSQDKGDIPGGSKLQLGYYQVVVWMWSTRDSLRGLWSPFKPEKAPGSFSISSHPWVVVFPDGASRKEPACNAGDLRDAFDPWVGKIPWRRKWQPTPGFSPGESHGQRSLAGYSRWSRA